MSSENVSAEDTLVGQWQGLVYGPDLVVHVLLKVLKKSLQRQDADALRVRNLEEGPNTRGTQK